MDEMVNMSAVAVVDAQEEGKKKEGKMLKTK